MRAVRGRGEYVPDVEPTMSSSLSFSTGALLLAGFILVLFLAFLAQQFLAPRRSRFCHRGASLVIDEHANVLIISQTDRTGVQRFPLGTVTWRDIGTSVRIASFKLPDAYAFGQFNDYNPHAVQDSIDVWVGQGNAGPLMRWLAHRAKRLAPDVEGHYRKLDAQKRQIAAAVRRHLPETPVVECDVGRLIDHYAYVAFLPSGFVYGMRGADSLPQPVLCVRGGDVHRGKGRTVEVEFLHSSPATFELTEQEMRLIQGLQEKGVLRLEPPRPNPY
ncbi:hypothetical protein [Luteibacter aegosomatissinici]|uniref:hypothetical protein n=1 Tax=Luteibacter aegosomatissinici TaxID=2911539 RepID=UPI001FF86AF7|nr:hypothetical protein [Luteibacter aegosomatissinici]UPG92841.1 hypothetical protein L2Y97_13300 [Luteibacter aegosomatissinici]